MRPPGADTVLVRYGALGTKSPRVRGRMEDQLVENVEALLSVRGIEGDVERQHARPLVRTTPGDVERAASVAAEAFGVVSTSPAVAVEPTKSVIKNVLARTARECYDRGTFAVDARRATEDLPFTSRDIEEEGGAAVWEAVEGEVKPTVDLDNPDLTFHVEVRSDEAYVFLENVRGPGGLPLGSQGRLIALISGGIDSPVAAYEVMRRGAPVVPVYLDLGDYGGPDHRARAIESVRTLARYAPNFSLRPYVVPAGEDVAHIAERVERGRMLSFRRYMFRVAEKLARRVDADGVVTGEALGQKSSQTAQNLTVTSAATDLPVHRPLLSMDKTDITELAREIGTFEDATIPAGCNRFAPERPETNGRLDRLLEVEPDDLFERAERMADRAELVELEVAAAKK